LRGSGLYCCLFDISNVQGDAQLAKVSVRITTSTDGTRAILNGQKHNLTYPLATPSLWKSWFCLQKNLDLKIIKFDTISFETMTVIHAPFKKGNKKRDACSLLHVLFCCSLGGAILTVTKALGCWPSNSSLTLELSEAIDQRYEISDKYWHWLCVAR
jgi:hypothetical protein